MSRFSDLRESIGTGTWLPRPDRRTLLIGGGAAIGLALTWAVWPRAPGLAINAAPGEQVLGAYLKIGIDGRVTVLVPQLEMGQGSYTLIAQVVADELGADWRTVAVEPAPLSGTYANHLLLEEDAAMAMPRRFVPESVSSMGGWRRTLLASDARAMLTGGSTTLRQYEQPARETAAYARALLQMAAADRWDVAWDECDAANGFITHGTRKLRFGDLAEAAALLDPPDWPPLRAPGTGALFGESPPRLDLPSKIDGSFSFAGDIRLHDMAYAAIRQGPIGDTRLKRYNRQAPRRVTGYFGAVRHDRWIAAVATNSWAAQQALNAMNPLFTTQGQRGDSAVVDRRLKAALSDFDGTRMVDEGSVSDAFAGRPVLTAEFLVAPALHAALETRTATAAWADGRVQLWVASQAPGVCRAMVAEALGIGEGQVVLFQMPAGGSFDAAYENEVAVQAAIISRGMKRPIQLVWSRTEDILRDLPRAPARARLSATLSSGTTIDGWHAAIATPASRHEWHGRLDGLSPQQAMEEAAGKADAAAINGAVPPYLIPNVAIDHLPVNTAIPSGQWRANADGYTAFFTECFVDELARAAGTDPFGFRIAMLGEQPELARCLQRASEIGGWSGGEAGSGQGLACLSMRGSHIALMAVARPGTSGLIVERIVAAADVGRVLNPGIAQQQIESGIVFGLAAAVGATTRYRRGVAHARALRDIGLPNFGQMPDISVELLPSTRAPGGFEEIGVPGVAPAIANALFTVTGQRLRRLPLSVKAIP
jgi:isoquinoline 1-oxidoreductase beta subunit